MLGVILCGGQSSRMGTDKGMLQHEAISWAEHAYNKLTSLQLQVVLSVNEQQLSVYGKTFEKAVMVGDDVALQIGGPLKGILSVHLKYPQKDLLVLACDMRDMQIETLNQLIAVSTDEDEEAFVFKNDEGFEPLCAIYTYSGLSKIYKLYQEGQLKKHSLQYALSLLNTCSLSIREELKSSFKNFNSPEDLSGL